MEATKYKTNSGQPIANMQDAFDRVCERLITHFDYGKCVTKFGYCSYRNTEGNSCAIGYLLPDDMAIKASGTVYGLLYPGSDIGKHLIPNFKFIASYANTTALEQWTKFYRDLQRVHDIMYNCGIDTMKNELKYIALDHGLVFKYD